MQIFMQAWMRSIIPRPFTILFLYFLFSKSRKIFILCDIRYCVHTKSIHSFIKPKFYHFIDFFSHLLVFPIQVRLLYRKNMEIIGSCFAIILPGASFLIKKTGPERRLSFF